MSIVIPVKTAAQHEWGNFKSTNNHTMTAEHTPGPWVIDNSAPNNDHSPYLSTGAQTIVANHGIGWNICEVMGNIGSDANTPTHESLANAHLIAAAPDLLEACEKAIIWLKAYGIDHGSSIIYTELTAARDKAKGGTK